VKIQSDMKKYRIYLDNCCFNRPFDNQNNLLVLLETEAKLFIQELILSGKLKLVWSFVLDYENNSNPFEERRCNIAVWKKLSFTDCNLCDKIIKTAEELQMTGLRQKDASHIACAIYAGADFFVTTDKKILNKQVNNIELINPIDFVRRYLDV
jgi:predicted nucleic acid-binding protein